MTHIAEPMPKVMFGIKVRVFGWSSMIWKEQVRTGSCKKCELPFKQGEVIVETAGEFSHRYHCDCAKKMVREEFDKALEVAVSKADRRLKELSVSKL